MSHLDKNVEILNDLLAIQHERVAAYQAFMKYPVSDESVYKLFKTIADRSRNLLFELRSHMSSSCSDPADRVEIRGEVCRSWPGIRFFKPDSTAADIFNCCEYNEWLTAMTYQHALEATQEKCPELQELLLKQFNRMKESFRMVHAEKERPAQPATSAEERVPFLFTRGEIFETA
jgi:uncharacterized protein (TIGR02284 family)